MMRDTHNHACAIFPTRCVVNHRLDFRGFIGLLGVRGLLFRAFCVRRCVGTAMVMPSQSSQRGPLSINGSIPEHYSSCWVESSHRRVSNTRVQNVSSVWG